MTERIEPLLGYREWQLKEGRLTALMEGSNVWVPGETRARCETQRASITHPPDEVPHGDCSCGRYAYYGRTSLSDRPALVRGVVQAWGTIELHQSGFRAEHARPVVLVEPTDLRLRGDVRAAARRYGARCVPEAEVEAVASEFGRFVSDTEQPVVPLLFLAGALRHVKHRRGIFRKPSHGHPAHEHTTWALAEVAGLFRNRGLLDVNQPDKCLAAVAMALDLVYTAWAELGGGDAIRDQLVERALRMAARVDASPEIPDPVVELSEISTGAEILQRTRARLSDAAVEHAGSRETRSDILSWTELEALVLAAARPDRSGDAVIEQLWDVVSSENIAAPLCATELLARGSRAGRLVSEMLRVPMFGQSPRLRPEERRVLAREVMADTRLRDSVTEATLLAALGDETSDTDVERMLREHRWGYTCESMLEQRGERGKTIARRLVRDVTLPRETRLGLVKFLGPEARDVALELFERNPLDFLFGQWAQIIGPDHMTRVGAAIVEDEGRPLAERLKAIDLLPSPDNVVALERFLRAAETVEQKNAVLRRVVDSTYRRNVDGELVHAVLAEATVDEEVALTLITRHPGSGGAAAKRLWETGNLNPYQAACVLEALWPEAPALAEEALADAGAAYIDTRVGARIAAAMTLLGPAHPGARETARALLADREAPVYLRVVAVATLGRAGADICEAIRRDEPYVDRRLLAAIERVGERPGTWPYRRFDPIRTEGLW